MCIYRYYVILYIYTHSIYIYIHIVCIYIYIHMYYIYIYMGHQHAMLVHLFWIIMASPCISLMCHACHTSSYLNVLMT
jgi:hypothetical protein